MARDRKSQRAEIARSKPPPAEASPDRISEPLIAQGDGIWVHDTESNPAIDSVTARIVPGKLQRRRGPRESEPTTKRPLADITLATELDFSDDLTLPRADVLPRSAPVPPKPEAAPQRELIPRLPPRPVPGASRAFAPRGTLKMGEQNAALPLPPPHASRIHAAPVIDPALLIGAFDDSPSHEEEPARPEAPPIRKTPTWLFAMLALSSGALALTGYAFIAEVGPFAAPASPATQAGPPILEPNDVRMANADTAPPVVSNQPAPPSSSPVLSLSQAPAESALTLGAPSATVDLKAVDANALPAAPAVDESALLSFQGYLIVHSTASVAVVVQGVEVGKTNRPLMVRCGPKNVRLRDGAQWLSEGQHVHVDCMKSTEVTINPPV